METVGEQQEWSFRFPPCLVERLASLKHSVWPVMCGFPGDEVRSGEMKKSSISSLYSGTGMNSGR